MQVQYNDERHEYSAAGVIVPSVTQMLALDGLSDHLDKVPAATLQAKKEWGTRLHSALTKAEYEFGVDEEFKQHCVDWLDVVRKMKWGKPDRNPIWKLAELPALGQYEGLFWGFTPDRAAPEAVVEFKGTYSQHISHNLQTAIQTIGMGYSRQTPRYVVYFDREGMKRTKGIILCGDTIERDGRTVSVWDESERIIFDYAVALPEDK
jgi:hypothetical protein